MHGSSRDALHFVGPRDVAVVAEPVAAPGSGELLVQTVVSAISPGTEHLEAMRAGVAVIASTAGGAGEVIDDGSEGWLVAPGDVQTLASRLGRLCEDRELLARMGLAARDRAQRHPRWDESLGHVRAFLRTTVAEHRPTGSEVAA